MSSSAAASAAYGQQDQAAQQGQDPRQAMAQMMAQRQQAGQGAGGLGLLARGIYDKMGGQPRGQMQPSLPQAPAGGPAQAPAGGMGNPQPQQGMGGLGQMARGIYDRLGGKQFGPMQKQMATAEALRQK